MTSSNRGHGSSCSLLALVLLLQCARAHATEDGATCLGAVSREMTDSFLNAKRTAQEHSWPECGLYLAESSIPNAGLGMYAGRLFAEDQHFSFGDVALQLQDTRANNRLGRVYRKDLGERNEDTCLLDDYYWNAVSRLPAYDALSVRTILPGVGMLANSYPGLANAKKLSPARNAYFHRGRDPGAGASSSYDNAIFSASVQVEPGAEIFLEYGVDWFEKRTAELGEIPLHKDYRKADELLQKFGAVTGGKLDTPLAKQSWELLTASLKNDVRVDTAMPNELKDIPCAVETGTSKRSHPDRIRSFDWLEQNGACIDNIRPVRSSIDQAGGGAFATRTLRQGQIIAPMPMVHLHRDQLAVYESPKSDKHADQIERVGSQLLLNYAYGHPESSLLLFPYSPIVSYVNHNATGYNAELRWSTMASHKAEWLTRTPDDIQSEPHAGLIMEMVATRDIEANEEIVLNYGKEWDTAWKDHVAHWSPTQEDKRYVSATELNQNMAILKTQDELENDAQARQDLASVYTLCFLKLTDKQTLSANGEPQVDWHYEPTFKDRTIDAHGCAVIERNVPTSGAAEKNVPAQAVSYTVALQHPLQDHIVLLTSIPRSAIQFVDKQYTADQFLRKAFRHEIGLPDHLLPPAWRDVPRPLSPMESPILNMPLWLLLMAPTLVGAIALCAAKRRQRRKRRLDTDDRSALETASKLGELDRINESDESQGGKQLRQRRSL